MKNTRFFLLTTVIIIFSVAGAAYALSEENQEDGRNHFNVIVMGTGPAGLTASINTCKAGFRTAIISEDADAVIKDTDTISSIYDERPCAWPIDVYGTAEKEFLKNIIEQVKQLNIDTINDTIPKVDFSRRPFKITGEKGKYTADAIIIATGLSAKNRLLEKYRNSINNLYTCVACDGYDYLDKNVAITGHSDRAIRESEVLAQTAKHLTIINPYEDFNIKPENAGTLDSLRKNNKVQIILNSSITEIVSNSSSLAITIKNSQTGKSSSLTVDGIFAINREPYPNTWMLGNQIKTDQYGYIITGTDAKAASQTNINGAFAAGTVANRTYQQVIISAASGAAAGIDASNFLKK